MQTVCKQTVHVGHLLGVDIVEVLYLLGVGEIGEPRSHVGGVEVLERLVNGDALHGFALRIGETAVLFDFHPNSIAFVLLDVDVVAERHGPAVFGEGCIEDG